MIVHPHVSLPLAVNVTFVFSSGVVFDALKLTAVGFTLFHVAVAVAQLLPLPCASNAL